MLRRAPASATVLLLLSCFALSSCGEESPDAPPVVDIIAEDHEFTVPDTIPSGWVIIRMHNQGSETHQVQFDQLPDDMTASEFEARVERLEALEDSLVKMLAAGTIDTAEAIRSLRKVAPELRKAVHVGLVGSGETARTTLRLEPGTYLLACRLNTPEDEDHGELGMEAFVEAAGPPSDARPPEPDVEVRYDSGRVTMDGSFQSGRQVVAFRVDAVPGEEDGLVEANLTRLGGTTVEELDHWMTGEGYYRNPAPTNFLAGAGIVERDSGYMTLNLDAGRYGWVISSEDELTVEEFTIE